MLKIAFTNIHSSFLVDDYAILEEKILETPENSGNFMFFQSIKEMCIKKSISLSAFTKESISEVNGLPLGEGREDYAIILVFANVIMNPDIYGAREDTRGYVAHYLDLCESIPDIPLYVFSLGCQNVDTSIFEIHPLMKKEIARMLKRAKFVGLRGDYTKLVLHSNNLDISNAAVVGCPSVQTRDIDSHLIQSRFEALSQDSKISINIPNPGHCSPVIQKQMDVMSTFADSVIVQDDQNVVHFARNLSYSIEDLEKRYGKKLLPGIIENQRNYHHFSSSIEWIDYLSSHADICFGTRIHGTIAGILAGLPSLCLAIDSRTLELCRSLYVPHIDCTRKNRGVDFLGALEGSPAEMKSNFISFFQENYSFDAAMFEANKSLQYSTYWKLVEGAGGNY